MTEKSPLTSPPSDAGKEEARKLYEETIADLKKSLNETKERIHLDRIKNERKRKETYEKSIKPIEEEIAAKEAEMRRALGGALTPKAGKAGVESDEIKLKRSWEKVREEKRKKEKEAREQERKARVEKKRATIEKFTSRVSPQEPPVLSEQEKSEERQEEREEKPKESKSWKIETLKGALEDLEKEREERREEETARLTKEAEEQERREKEGKEKEPPQTREEKIAAFRARRAELERKNKAEGWDSDEDFQKFGMESADRETAGNYNFDTKKIDEAIEEAKKGKNPRYRKQSIERLQRAKALIEKEIGVATAESLARKKEEGIIENMKSPEGASAPIEEARHGVETPSSRVEKLEAFTTRRKELAKQLQTPSLYYNEKNEEERKQHEKDIEEFNVRSMAERYGFNLEQIEEEIKQEKAKLEKGDVTAGSYKLFQLERAKELVGREIGAETSQSFEPEKVPTQPPVEAHEAEPRKEEPKVAPPPENIAREAETPLEKDRDALKRKLFPEQFRKLDKKGEQTPQGAPAEQATPEAQPVQSPAPEGAIQESPEMGRAINELLGEELGGSAQTREAAAAVVEARRAMQAALATRKEERLYAEAGAGFIAPERLQEAEQIEKAYEDALVGLSARLRESAQNDEAFLAPYLNIQNAEAMRIAQMREAALTPEKRSIAVRLYQRLNNPFNRDVPPRWARYVRVGLTAAVLGGGAAALGGAGALGITGYAGWRMGKSFAYMAANGIARSGIDMALTRHADAMMGEERGKQRIAIQEALKNNERIETLQESMRASIRAFQGEANAQLENRKFYGRAAMFGLMGLSGLVSYELARPSAVAADKGAFGGHIATNEDVLRQRFYETTGNVKEWGEETASSVMARAKELYNSGFSYGESFIKSLEEAAAKAETYVFGGKSSAEVIEDVMGKAGAGGVAGAAGKAPLSGAGETAPPSGGGGPDIWTHEEAPMGPEFPKTEGGVSESGGGFGSPEEEAALLKRARGGLPPHQDIDSVRERIRGESEDIAKANETLERIGETPIATIEKDGSIWRASRSLIGEGEGKISKEQWLEAWEKSGLADKGFVKPGATVRFDAAEGLLKVSEAKDNEFLYQALQKEGKPIPGWLEDLRDVKEGRPSVADVVDKSAKQSLARPAAPPTETFETPVAGAKGGTFEQLLQNEEAQKYYVDSFGRHSFDQQEALLVEFKNAAERLEENVKGDVHSSVRAAYEQEVAQTKSFISHLENNAEYQENLRAWEGLEKEWGRKVGVSEEQFAELGNKWSVERFLDTAKKIENRDFVPSDQLSKILEARRLGTLEMAEKIRSQLPDRSALKMPLGRFLKNTL